jgi:polysaccharide deacetylase 2 family uncharacterized protein YibQ
MESQNPAERPVPSLWRHVIAAAMLLAAVALFIATTAFTGTAPRVGGEVALPDRPLPPSADTLMADTGEETLPDLLQGVVADGDNPTENMTGGETSTPDPSGPKTIAVEVTRPDPLPKAPIADLQSEGSYGPIPTPSTDGRTAFKTYARPHASSSKPRLSLVVGGLGISPEMTRRAIEDLPPEVTLAFAAHAPNLQTDIDRAREYGHEVILELPMEGQFSDPGEPGADRMLRADDPAGVLNNLDWLLSRAGGYFAVAPYNGDIFLARSDAAGPVLSKLEGAGVGFLADPQLSVPVLESSAKTIGLPFRAGSMLIDDTPEVEAIARDLEKLRALALAGDAPVGFGFAYPQTIDALILFLPTLKQAELAPASAAFAK